MQNEAPEEFLRRFSVSKKRQSRFFEKGCMAEGARFLAKLSSLPP